MNAQPGWYDAGVAGRERWWDGLQWTVHERAVPVQGTPMGWYPVGGTSDVRWWDGAGWTPYRLRDGNPRPDAFAIEPGNTAIGLGIAFIVLSIAQFANSSRSEISFFAVAPLFFLVAGVLWLAGGVRVSQTRKHPAPQTVPIFDPSTRPLPGEVEGAGAGWYAVSGQITRWWTGARWSQYVGQKFGVRPTHAGPRAYRVSMILGWVFVGLAVLAAVLGFGMIATIGTLWGIAIAIPALVFGLVGALVLVLTYVRRYTMIVPPQAPLMLD